jgi:DNA-binding transcriptional regulator LsrR (DeoR family)
VGDICLHFFNEQGNPVATPLHDRVIGMSLEQLRRVGRVVGVAGGKRKTVAIKGALAGGWINILITDRNTAERLLKG